MNEEERGYRQAEPLADIIPPDRRRLRSIALVVVGMIAGASLLVLGQEIATRARAKSEEPRAPVITSFAAAAETQDVASPGYGRIRSDGVPDETFELVVEGPVLGVVVAQYDRDGQPIANALRWGTVDWSPSALPHATHDPPGPGVWQLAVTEDGRLLNVETGAITPLDDGTHRLVLHLASAGAFTSGAYVRAHVIGRGPVVARSNVVNIAGNRPSPKAPPPPPVGEESETLSDRGAAAKALGAVRIEHCAKLAGAKPTGRVQITFAPEGTVTSATVVDGIDPKTPAARCVSVAFEKSARVPAFSAGPVRMNWSFTLPTTGPEAR